VAKHSGRIQVQTRDTEPTGTVFRLLLSLTPTLSATSYQETLPSLS
jgi:hypothetical protein